MQTVEEFAVELSTKEVKSSDQYSQGLKVGIEFGVEKGAEFMQKQYDDKLRWIPISEQTPPQKIQLEFKKIDDGFVNICKVEELEGKLCLLASLGYGLLSDTSFTHWRSIP